MTLFSFLNKILFAAVRLHGLGTLGLGQVAAGKPDRASGWLNPWWWHEVVFSISANCIAGVVGLLADVWRNHGDPFKHGVARTKRTPQSWLRCRRCQRRAREGSVSGAVRFWHRIYGSPGTLTAQRSSPCFSVGQQQIVRLCGPLGCCTWRYPVPVYSPRSSRQAAG